MRIGKVIGRLTLNRWYETLAGGRFLLVQVQDRFVLAGQSRKSQEVLVVYDHLGARDGDTIGIAEAHGASGPFLPKRVPLDAYNACILEAVVVARNL